MCRRTFWKGDGQKISSVVFREYPRQGLRIQDIGMHGIAGRGCLCIVDKATICFRSQRTVHPKFLEPLRPQRVSGDFRQQASDMWTTEGAEPDLGLRRVVRIAHIKVRVSEQPEQSHEIRLEQQVHMDECTDTPPVMEVPLLRMVLSECRLFPEIVGFDRPLSAKDRCSFRFYAFRSQNRR